MRKMTIGLAMLGMLFTMPGYAKRITLKQAINAAIGNSYNVKMAAHQVDAANYGAKAALMDMLPKVSVGMNYYRMGPIPTFNFSFMPKNPGTISPQCVQTLGCLAELMKGVDTSAEVGKANNFNFNAQIVQPLTPLFSMYHLKRIKDIDARAAVINRESAKELVKLNVQSMYLGLLQIKRTQQALISMEHSLQEHLKQVQAFVSAGMAARVDALRVKVRLGQTRSSMAQLDAQYKATMAAFNAMIGLPRDQDTQLTEPKQGDAPLKTLKFYRDQALTHNLNLSGMRHKLQEAAQGVSLAKTAFIPQGSVFARYGYQYGNEFMPDWSWQVGVNLQWQWEWWKKGYMIDQARARLAQLKEGLEALKQGVLAQVDKAYYNVFAQKRKLEYWQVAVKQAQDVYRLTEDRYKAGTATNTDVLDAQGALIGSKASYYAAVYGLMLAKAFLHEAVYGALPMTSQAAAQQGSNSQSDTQKQGSQKKETAPSGQGFGQ